MSWIFEKSGPMGGAAGEAYANTLKSPGMPPAHVLAREAIQNSVDAANGAAKVAMRFRAVALESSAKHIFVEAAGLPDIAERASALQLGPNSLSTLNKAQTPLPLLFVEDYNTEGPTGSPNEPGGRRQ